MENLVTMVTDYATVLSNFTGAMDRARRFADVAACRAVSSPDWCRVFREISFFSTLNLGTLYRWCALGQGTSPSNAALDSGGN